MGLLIKRIGLFLAVLLLTIALLKVAGVEHNSTKDMLIFRLSNFGSLSFFFGPYLIGSGGWIHAHKVNAPTPEIAWRVLGVLLWLSAGGCFIGMA
jgi:hypothetical protein